MKENKTAHITLYFDGDCPLCKREINFLKKITPKDKVSFEDISEENFKEDKHGKSCSKLMAEIHAKTSDGQWLIGMDAFRAVYSYTKFSFIFNLTKLPILRQSFDFMYKLFAKNRLKLTGRSSSNQSSSCNL